MPLLLVVCRLSRYQVARTVQRSRGAAVGYGTGWPLSCEPLQDGALLHSARPELEQILFAPIRVTGDIELPIACVGINLGFHWRCQRRSDQPMAAHPPRAVKMHLG